MKVVLTIAGSDSGGGAGIQADLKTFEAHGVFGVSVITAITAQNTMGVRSVLDVPPSIVRDQLDAIFEDFDIAAVKIGMLSNAEIIDVVSDRLSELRIPIVLDPVMVATSGDILLHRESVDHLIRKLIPLSTIVTPNLPEVEVLTASIVTNVDDMIESGRMLVSAGAHAVLVKGGHIGNGMSRREAVDVLCTTKGDFALRAPWVSTNNTHGTGCTLSAAIAANLATGLDVLESVRAAKDYLHGALSAAPDIGSGSGPLRHGWRTNCKEFVCEYPGRT